MFKNLLAVVSLLSIAGLVHAGTLVTNGGFETGDLTGWSQDLGGVALAFCNSAFFPSNSGNCAASLTNGNFEILSQTLTTTPGASYDFDFWLQQTSTGSPESFAASWDGNTVFSIPSQSGPMAYTHESFTNLTASGATTKISFSGNGLVLERWVLDDVSVAASAVAVPEPATLGELFAGFAVLGLLSLRARRQRSAGAAR